MVFLGDNVECFFDPGQDILTSATHLDTSNRKGLIPSTSSLNVQFILFSRKMNSVFLFFLDYLCDTKLNDMYLCTGVVHFLLLINKKYGQNSVVPIVIIGLSRNVLCSYSVGVYTEVKKQTHARAFNLKCKFLRSDIERC